MHNSPQSHSTPPNPALEELARKAREELHEYFEWVRNDSLRVPDDDKTETILLRAFAAHRELMKGELKGVGKALGTISDNLDGVDSAYEEASNIGCECGGGEGCRHCSQWTAANRRVWQSKDVADAALRTLENLGEPRHLEDLTPEKP